MRQVLILTAIISFTACSSEPAARQKTVNSEKDGNYIEVVDTALVESMIQELNECSADGKLYEFSSVPGSPGTCTEKDTLDIDCSESGIKASSQLKDSQKSLFSMVIDEEWDSINAPDSVKENLMGVSEHEVYACAGSYLLLDVYTYKVDRSTGLVENKIINLHAKEDGN